LLLAAVAAAPIAEFTYVWGYRVLRHQSGGGWLAQITRWFEGTGALLGLAVLVGVAVASGLSRQAAPPSP
jgi:hypothetical protein